MDRLEPGTVFADRYRVEAHLGAGGMGLVARARDVKLERDVAIKVLPPRSLGNDAARLRMMREARAAAKLQHPNIVHMYDVGETDDGGAFLVMELVGGESFGSKVATGGMGRADRMRAVIEVARALAFAHRAGLVHRDVKPDNVMIRDDGRAVILDFGLAKSVGIDAAAAVKVTTEGSIVGTPAYMSPEQAYAREIDGRADQWSVAVMAYEALTGHLPFDGANPTAIIAAILTTEPAPPSAVSPSLDAQFDTVILRALAKEPDARFADCDAFADALAAVPIANSLTPMAARTPDALTPTRAMDANVIDVASTGSAPTEPGITNAPQSSPAQPTASTKTSRDATNGTRRSGLVAVVALAAGVVGGGAIVAQRFRTPTSPLARPGARLACPPLEASGVTAPAGWLGAAAAVTACNAIYVTMLGRVEQYVHPADLLGFAHRPDPNLANDPYGAPGARARAVDAARRTADAWLDGSIARDASGFRIELVMRNPEGRELARATGRGEVVYLAAEQAVADLARAGLVPVARAVTPFWREQYGAGATLDSVRSYAVMENEGAQQSSRLPAICDEIERKVATFGPDAPLITRRCALATDRPLQRFDPPAIDRSSTSRLVSSLTVNLFVPGSFVPEPWIPEVRAAAGRTTNLMLRSELYWLEGMLRARARDSVRAREAQLLAIQPSLRARARGMCSRSHRRAHRASSQSRAGSKPGCPRAT